jgi:hypothetical protein
VSAKFWCQQSSGVSKILVPEKCAERAQVRTAQVPKLGRQVSLAPEALWHQKSAGTKKGLAPEKC